MIFRSYIDPAERRDADRKLPRLLFEGLLLGGSGLGVLALIFEIAADAFSVAAYQTLLAIHGAEGYHEIAMAAFTTLSVLLFLGIVPAYKAGAYLRPNAGGSGPLVEAIGPQRMRGLSWVGSSLFFIDAILTIIISSISASDVTMLIFPELAPYRIVLAEVYAFFIMVVLVALGPKRAVPIFLIGGGAFTVFTIFALSIVGTTAVGNPQWAFMTEGIVNRLQATGVVEHVVAAQQELSSLSPTIFMQLFLRSMSSAMLGFSGYEVIPASGKHAARPKWKVINTALTLAAVFLIGTGVVQLLAAQRWNIPSTEGYSTLLIEYEIVAVQTLGNGLDEDDIIVTDADRTEARRYYESLPADRANDILHRFADDHRGDLDRLSEDQYIELIAYELAFSRAVDASMRGTGGGTFLTVAGVLLAVILLLAQGGGYVGGAAVAANAARLGRLPGVFSDDRIGIAVIWLISAIMIPIIRQVIVVEAYYAFGFVSAFIITSTTVFFVRDDVLVSRGIEPGSPEAKSLKFAGLRGMIASYFMGFILITQKTDALFAIVFFGGLITVFQIYIARGNVSKIAEMVKLDQPALHESKKRKRTEYDSGEQRAHEEARRRGLAHALIDMIEAGDMNKFNVEPERIIRLVCYTHDIAPYYFDEYGHDGHEHERFEEPSVDLQATYDAAYNNKQQLLLDIEVYSHYGIFTFINNYYRNWISPDHGRDDATVQRAMLDLLFPLTDHDLIYKEYCTFEPRILPEPIWQFSRERYRWAKDQWPNLSDRITTIWTLQDFGLIPDEIDVKMVISVASGRTFRTVQIHTHGPEENSSPISEPRGEVSVPDNGHDKPDNGKADGDQTASDDDESSEG